MSATTDNHASHDHHHDDHGHGHDEHSHGSVKSYVTGFILSVILTAIPFWLVMADVMSDKTTLVLVIMGLGVVQIFVHMIYFLHMNGKSEGGWTLMALLFTVILVLITLVGSLWVLYHLTTNMMPAMTIDQIKNLP